jgi:hypothetical protein
MHESSGILIDCYDFCAVNDRDRLMTIKRKRTVGAAEDAEWCATDDLLQIIALAGAELPWGCIQHVLVDQVVAGEASVDDVIYLVDQITV